MPGPNAAAKAAPANNIWAQMNYVVPRGRCNHKPSLLTAVCPCLRFMAHPLQAATSFECDGCGHHASFHMLQNKEEDEVVARWRAEQAVEDAEERERVQLGKRRRVEPKRRTLAIAAQDEQEERVVEVESDGLEEMHPGAFGDRDQAEERRGSVRLPVIAGRGRRGRGAT